MRLALLALACLLSAPLAMAQSPVFTVQLHGIPTEPIPAGAGVRIGVAVELDCSVPATTGYEVFIELNGPSGTTITGPSSVHFPGGSCTNPQFAEADYQVFLAANTTPLQPQKFMVHVQPQSSGPAFTGGGNSVEQSFALTAAAPEESGSLATQQAPDRESPTPAAALVGMVLLACALILRRRA